MRGTATTDCTEGQIHQPPVTYHSSRGTCLWCFKWIQNLAQKNQNFSRWVPCLTSLGHGLSNYSRHRSNSCLCILLRPEWTLNAYSAPWWGFTGRLHPPHYREEFCIFHKIQNSKDVQEGSTYVKQSNSSYIRYKCKVVLAWSDKFLGRHIKPSIMSMCPKIAAVLSNTLAQMCRIGYCWAIAKDAKLQSIHCCHYGPLLKS